MHWEKEMLKLISDKTRHLKMDDKIHFRCLKCGRCCWNKDIILNSYDIARLKRSLKMRTTDMWKAGFLSVHIGANSGLPVCMIKFVGDEQHKRCPFLAPVLTQSDTTRALNELKRKGIRDKDDFQREFFEKVKDKVISFACGVYPDRPTVCRAYPIGRAVEKKTKSLEDGEAIWFMMDIPDWCGARDTEYTLKEWLNKEEYWHFREGSDLFNKIIDKLIRAGISRKPADFAINKKPFEIETMNLVAAMLYDFDASDKLRTKPDDMKHAGAMKVVRALDIIIEQMYEGARIFFNRK